MLCKQQYRHVDALTRIGKSANPKAIISIFGRRKINRNPT
jgi:hypothetical protein